MKTLPVQQGFTVIELLIVILIVGVLASIAEPPPPCGGYYIGAKVREGLALATTAKTVVAGNAANNLVFDTGWKAPNATMTVSSKANPRTEDLNSNTYTGITINPDNGIITVTYTDKEAKGSPTILLIPVVKGDQLLSFPVDKSIQEINWECHSATAPAGDALPQLLGTFKETCYVPTNCKYVPPPSLTLWEKFTQKLHKWLS